MAGGDRVSRLGILAFCGMRWAYVTFVVLGILFFPARVGFHFHPQPCECGLTIPLALFSLTKYGHIWRFAILFLLTSVQLRGHAARTQYLISAGAVLAFGIYVELAEGFTGNGHCRLRDLIPDIAGALIGAILLASWQKLRKSTGSPGSAPLP